MIRKISILLLSFLMLWTTVIAQSQEIRVKVTNMPLNQVLLLLRKNYDFKFSYSENELAKYKVTLNKTFTSKEETLKFLLDGLPYHIRKIDDVFVIIPDKIKKVPEEKKTTMITGQVVEAGSSEPLPFSQIMINNHPMISDVTGNFNFMAAEEESYRVQISHLGYSVCDTLLYAGTNHQFKLTPSAFALPEVQIREMPAETATMLGENAGKITINHNIARFLPGQGDNSVFNLIRLMPGIQAAGEQTEDLLIWGSYEGQNLVTFDEFTLFGLKNYNDNISVVNPFLVKNIEIMKGGFDSRYGNRVGGIINITGKNGNMQKPVFSLNVNPTTINGMAELPLWSNSSLQLAYRQTYYNLYNSGDFNIFAPIRSTPKLRPNGVEKKNVTFDSEVLPDDYQFRDFNLKFTQNFDSGDQFYLSFYGGGDYFRLQADANTTREIGKKISVPLAINMQDIEKNRQIGASIFVNHKWSDKLISKFVSTYSDFSKEQTDSIKTINSLTQNIYNSDQAITKNIANERSFRIENILTLLNGHQLEFGAGLFANEAEINLKFNLNNNIVIDTLNRFVSNRVFAYVQDNLPLGKLIIKSGVRFSQSLGNSGFVAEPRISAGFHFSHAFNANLSWGRYHQYIYKVANIDRSQNYTYLWVTNNQTVPLLNATHWVGELNYFKHGLTVNLQAYYKPTGNLSERVYEQRTVRGVKVERYFPYFGDSKTYGMDLFVKKEFGKHSVWASYTLSKALERFAPQNQNLPEYTLAPQHQLHEFKAAALFNVHPFYFSANYVYGSGLEVLRKVFGPDANIAYNRVDVSATLKFARKKLDGELGLSVLNVFDTENLRYANLKNFQLTPELGDFRVYSSSVPLTPVLFLKLVF